MRKETCKKSPLISWHHNHNPDGLAPIGKRFFIEQHT